MAASASGQTHVPKGTSRSRKGDTKATRSKHTATTNKSSAGSKSLSASASSSTRRPLLLRAAPSLAAPPPTRYTRLAPRIRELSFGPHFGSYARAQSPAANAAIPMTCCGNPTQTSVTRARARARVEHIVPVPQLFPSMAQSRKILASSDDDDFNFEQVMMLPPARQTSGDPVASFLAGNRHARIDSPPRGSCAAARAAAAAASTASASASRSAAASPFEPTIGSAQTSSSSSGSQRAVPASHSPTPPREATSSARAGRQPTARNRNESPRGARLGDSAVAPIELSDTVALDPESLEEELLLVPAATSSQHASVDSVRSPPSFTSAQSSQLAVDAALRRGLSAAQQLTASRSRRRLRFHLLRRP